jgi:hypothetical protein
LRWSISDLTFCGSSTQRAPQKLLDVSCCEIHEGDDHDERDGIKQVDVPDRADEGYGG